MSQWLGERRVLLTGHEWEETLLTGMGDLMRIQRHMPMPGIDSLWERGRSPRDFDVTDDHFLNEAKIDDPFEEIKAYSRVVFPGRRGMPAKTLPTLQLPHPSLGMGVGSGPFGSW